MIPGTQTGKKRTMISGTCWIAAFILLNRKEKSNPEAFVEDFYKELLYKWLHPLQGALENAALTMLLGQSVDLGGQLLVFSTQVKNTYKNQEVKKMNVSIWIRMVTVASYVWILGTSAWSCLRRNRRGGFVGKDVPLWMNFEVSKVHTVPSISPPTCWLRCEFSAAPATMPLDSNPLKL